MWVEKVCGLRGGGGAVEKGGGGGGLSVCVCRHPW